MTVDPGISKNDQKSQAIPLGRELLAGDRWKRTSGKHVLILSNAPRCCLTFCVLTSSGSCEVGADVILCIFRSKSEEAGKGICVPNRRKYSGDGLKFERESFCFDTMTRVLSEFVLEVVQDGCLTTAKGFPMQPNRR